MTISQCKAKDPFNCRFHGTGKFQAALVGGSELERNKMLWNLENAEPVLDATIAAAQKQVNFLAVRNLSAKGKAQTAVMRRSIADAKVQLANLQARKDFLYPRTSARVLADRFEGQPDMNAVQARNFLAEQATDFHPDVMSYASKRIDQAFASEKTETVPADRFKAFIVGAWYK